MRYPALVLIACLVLPRAATASTQPASGTETADWVARHVDERDTGRDSRIEMVMTLADRQGRTRERRLTLTSRRGRGTEGDRVLVRFEAPGDIRGTGLLVLEHRDADDERFLYLPALGRVRRIAGAERQESFVGSDLSYEDIGGRDFEDYRYTLVDSHATWTAPDGTAHAAWQLESVSRDDSAVYPRIVSLVRKDNFVVVAADMFNRRGEAEKHYAVHELRQVEGIWTVALLSMTNTRLHTKTTLAVESADYDVGLPDAAFTRRALERPPQ